MTEEFDEYTLRYEDSEETKNMLFNKVLAFFREHEAYSGESIMQCDAPQIAAPELLSDIAEDILKFQTTWK